MSETYDYSLAPQRFGVIFAGTTITFIALLVALWDERSTPARVSATIVAISAIVGTIALVKRLPRRALIIEDGMIGFEGFNGDRTCRLSDVELLSVFKYTTRGGTTTLLLLWVPATPATRTRTGILFRLGIGLDRHSNAERRRVETETGTRLAPFSIPLNGLEPNGVRSLIGVLAPLDTAGELTRRGVVRSRTEQP